MHSQAGDFGECDDFLRISAEQRGVTQEAPSTEALKNPEGTSDLPNRADFILYKSAQANQRTFEDF